MVAFDEGEYIEEYEEKKISGKTEEKWVKPCVKTKNFIQGKTEKQVGKTERILENSNTNNDFGGEDEKALFGRVVDPSSRDSNIFRALKGWRITRLFKIRRDVAEAFDSFANLMVSLGFFDYKCEVLEDALIKYMQLFAPNEIRVHFNVNDIKMKVRVSAKKQLKEIARQEILTELHELDDYTLKTKKKLLQLKRKAVYYKLNDLIAVIDEKEEELRREAEQKIREEVETLEEHYVRALKSLYGSTLLFRLQKLKERAEKLLKRAKKLGLEDEKLQQLLAEIDKQLERE